eukprot:1181824-Prorocentrum_minimum.AAC.3
MASLLKALCYQHETKLQQGTGTNPTEGAQIRQRCFPSDSVSSPDGINSQLDGVSSGMDGLRSPPNFFPNSQHAEICVILYRSHTHEGDDRATEQQPARNS